jgi:ferric-dicitrate binding protein FerR (iron transport regulator)
MKETPYHIAWLIAGYIRNTLSEQEQIDLDNWVNESDENLRLFEELTDEDNLAENLAWMDQVKSRESFQALQKQGAFVLRKKSVFLQPFWIAAASILLAIGLFFVYRYMNKQEALPTDLVDHDTHAFPPGGNRATLTLEDGSVIDLTTAVNGQLALGKGSHVRKPADGELVYEQQDPGNRIIAVHTLSTPVGGQYQLLLPDGSRVWLNAASQLKYPSAFTGKERVVELQGEAYFEVAKKEGQTFTVQLKDGAAIQVLGTQFNVQAYVAETAKEITLLEGKVSVVNAGQSVALQPGQQAVLNADGLSTKNQVNTEAVIAWKNGEFVFQDASIETIMKQVERWYGAKIVYEGEVKQLFNASILRKEPLTKLLRLLELTGQVKFNIENQTIHVLPR